MPVDKNDSHHCYLHDESGDAEWWDKHIALKVHLHQSARVVCKDCNDIIENPDDYKGKLHEDALHPAYCIECKKRLKEQL